jgi:16S rRNA G966 N2-methylase RsmD
LLLLGRKATNEGIRDAIFSWLKHPIEEDLVFIFFAGHGFRLPLKI